MKHLDTAPAAIGRRIAYAQYDAYMAGDEVCEPVYMEYRTWAEWCESAAYWERRIGSASEMIAGHLETCDADSVAAAVAAYLNTCEECAAGYRYVGGE